MIRTTATHRAPRARQPLSAQIDSISSIGARQGSQPARAVSSECRRDLLRDQTHILLDITLATRPAHQHRTCAGVDIFLEPLVAVLGIPIERVPSRDFREILRVVLTERLRCRLARFVAIRIDRRKHENPRAELAHVAPRLFAELMNLREALVQHLGRVHAPDPAVGILRCATVLSSWIFVVARAAAASAISELATGPWNIMCSPQTR